MMKYICSLFFLLCALSVFNSCKEDVPLMYEEDSRVYFWKRAASNRDSVNYSFTFEPNSVQTDTVELRFRIIGFAKDYDRAISLDLVEGSTAKEGYHYKINNLFIPANSSDGTAYLIFFRKPGLKDSVVTADFRIKENENFKPGYEDKDFGSALNRLTYKFSLTDRLSKPSTWDTNWVNLFGTYSDRKILFLTDLLDYTNWGASFVYPQDGTNMRLKARFGLYEYERIYGPMIDENGNRVEIP